MDVHESVGLSYVVKEIPIMEYVDGGLIIQEYPAVRNLAVVARLEGNLGF